MQVGAEPRNGLSVSPRNGSKERRPLNTDYPQSVRSPLGQTSNTVLKYRPKPIALRAQAHPLAGDGLSVRLWFNALVDDAVPATDDSLESAPGAASAYASMAKADNTGRAWCRWCDYHRLSPLPASGTDVAAVPPK